MTRCPVPMMRTLMVGPALIGLEGLRHADPQHGLVVLERVG